jgi:hypothetical protein
MDLESIIVRIWSHLTYQNKCFLNPWVELFSRVSNPRKTPRPIRSSSIHIPDDVFNSITPEEVLFLVFWLSAVVFPSSFDADAVRFSLIVPACQLARGVRLSLAPRVLCQIYRSLNEMVMEPRGPLRAASYYPAHDFYGWLGVYFPWVYGFYETDDSVRLWHFSRRFMATLSFEEVTERLMRLNQQTQRIFLFSPTMSDEDDERTRNDALSPRDTEYAMSIQACLLPLREGTRFMVEPSFPYRFARQFGADQGVPPRPPRVTRDER